MGSYNAARLSDLGEIIGDGQLVLLDPENWRGKRFPLLDYVDIGERFKEGKWLVMLYHHDCPKCQEAIHDFQEYCGAGGNSRVALIEMPPYGNSTAILGLEQMKVLHGHLDTTHEWFARAPVFVTLGDGQVLE